MIQLFALDRSRSKKSVPTESIFRLMQAGPRPICTLLVVKPHVVTKGIPKLMKKLTHEGFHIVALKQMMLSRDQAEGLVPSGDAQVFHESTIVIFFPC